MKKKQLIYSLPIVCMAWLTGCTSNNNENTTTRLTVALTDSPGDYDQVNVDVQSVQVHTSSSSDSVKGWVTLDSSNVGVVNLLDYTNGGELTLFDGNFPTGNISQVRLVLGTNNTVKVNNTSYNLTTPSAQQSGLKLNVNTDLLAGVTYKFTLDFDASKSVVETGNSHYILKPVIKVVTDATSGAISGIVNPASENVALLVMSGSDTVSTSYAPAGTAQYLVPGVPAGTYNLIFDPGTASTYQSDTLSNVTVSLGNVTKADTVNLTLK